MTQSGFGFAPSMGAPRPANKVVRLRRCDLFWMVEDGTGWRPFRVGTESVDYAVAEARRTYPASVVRVVDESEVR